jgi:branched-chain amino acid transport system substrate-binding protein
MTLSDDAVGLFEALHRADPSARLFAPDALAAPQFAAGLGPGAARQTSLTSVTPDASVEPGRMARFTRAYRERYGRDPEPYAIYGYEAMRGILQAVADAGNRANRRSAVLRAFFALRERRSALGSFSISPQGDTSLDRYAVQRVREGRLDTERVVRAGA